MEDLICYELDEPNSDHLFLTSPNLEEQERTELIQFLIANIKVLTWRPEIAPNFINTQVEHSPQSLTNETTRKKVHDRACGCCDRRGRKDKRGKCNNKGSLPELVVKHSRGKKEDEQVKSLRQLHKPQSGLSERLFSYAQD